MGEFPQEFSHSHLSSYLQIVKPGTNLGKQNIASFLAHVHCDVITT